MPADRVVFEPAAPTYITPIKCELCGSEAHLMRRTPAVTEQGTGETRTFECFECHSQTSIFILEESGAGA